MGWLDVAICKIHAWVFVETWQGIGREECTVCGMTRSIEEKVQAEVLAAMPAPEPAPGKRKRAPRMVTMQLGEDMVFTTRREDLPSMPDGAFRNVAIAEKASARPSVAVAEERAKGVLAELAKGTRVAVIAVLFGISQARVYQIRAAAKAAEAAQ